MWVAFELMIWFFLVATAAFLVVWVRAKKHKIWSVLFLIAWLVVAYGSFVEPRILVVRETTINVAGGRPDGIASLRAAVVSDLHVGPYKKSGWARRVVSKVNEQKPDIIFLLGDFVFSGQDDVAYLDPLKDLDAPLGVYAVTGNHEYESRAVQQTIAKLKELGVLVLENESVATVAHGREFVLAGVSDIWFAGNVQQTLADVRDEDTVILLTHNPDVILDPATKLADVVLAGHTHGGQIRLPFLGAVPPIPDKLGRAFDRGLFHLPAQQLFITSGVGETGPRARLFNPPEVAVVEIFF